MVWCAAVTDVNRHCGGCCKETGVWACPVRGCRGFLEGSRWSWDGAVRVLDGLLTFRGQLFVTVDVRSESKGIHAAAYPWLALYLLRPDRDNSSKTCRRQLRGTRLQTSLRGGEDTWEWSNCCIISAIDIRNWPREIRCGGYACAGCA